jgi:hypothetical protein
MRVKNGEKNGRFMMIYDDLWCSTIKNGSPEYCATMVDACAVACDSRDHPSSNG